jgi:tetratricopeptide (TPR) repeat protein
MPKKSNNLRKNPTLQDERDLEIEINFMEGLIRRDPTYVEALQILGDGYTRRGRYKDGLRVDQSLSRLRPQDALVHYNLACSYSLTGQCDLAVAALDRAIQLGYRDFKWLSKDPDLKNLRSHALYKKLQAKVRALKLQRR